MTQSERSQIRDGTHLVCSYAIGLRGSLSRVPEGGAMWIVVFVTPSIVHSLCVIR